jgi:transposase-like protein
VELVQRAVGPSANYSHLGREFSVSRQTVGKWVRRYQAEGDAGLRDLSCRPTHSPTQLRRVWRRQIERRRRQRHSSLRIARALNVARVVNIDAALSNGFGFGGANASLLFRRV